MLFIVGVDKFHQDEVEDEGPQAKTHQAHSAAEAFPVGEVLVAVFYRGHVAEPDESSVDDAVDDNVAEEAVDEGEEEDGAADADC